MTVPLFHRPEIGSGGATMRSLPGSEPNEMVQIDRIDDILAHFEHPPIRFVKLDVEGYEYEALQGAPRLLAEQPIVWMEYSRLVVESSAAQSAQLLSEAIDAVVYRMAPDGSLVRLIGDPADQEELLFVPRSRLGNVTSRMSVRG